MNAVDTNILLYVRDLRDTRKQAIASELIIGLADVVLLWQVACEYLAASRKLGLSYEDACQHIYDFQKVWHTALPTWTMLERSQDLMNRYCLSHWDAMIVSACLEAKVKTLYSEDFGYPRIEDLQLINPFKGQA